MIVLVQFNLFREKLRRGTISRLLCLTDFSFVLLTYTEREWVFWRLHSLSASFSLGYEAGDKHGGTKARALNWEFLLISLLYFTLCCPVPGHVLPIKFYCARWSSLLMEHIIVVACFLQRLWLLQSWELEWNKVSVLRNKNLSDTTTSLWVATF